MRFHLVIFLFSILISVTFGKYGRIIGGEMTDIDEFPYMASFRYTIPNLTFCGGAIISTKHILSAAHCLFRDERRFHMIRIYTGITETHKLNGPTHEIDQYIPHPRYTGMVLEGAMNAHDIAVIKIRGVIEFNSHQNKIDLPFRDVRHQELAVLTGWGMKSFPTERPPPKLKKVEMEVFHHGFCSRIVPRQLHRDQFCAFNSIGVGPCSGDSGSPLVSEGRVIGIVSFNIPCAIGVPDIYTNVYSYLGFVQDAMER